MHKTANIVPVFCKKSGLDVILAAFPSFLPQINKNKPWQGAKVEGCEINIGIVPFRKIRLKMWGCEITNLLILLSCTEGPSDVEVCLVQG